MNTSVVFDQAVVPTTLESLRPGDFCICSPECSGANGTCACQSSPWGGVAYSEGGQLEDAYLELRNEEDADYCKKGGEWFKGDSVNRKGVGRGMGVRRVLFRAGQQGPAGRRGPAAPGGREVPEAPERHSGSTAQDRRARLLPG